MGFSHMISMMSEKKEKLSFIDTFKRSIQAIFRRKKNKATSDQNADIVAQKENVDETKNSNDVAESTVSKTNAVDKQEHEENVRRTNEKRVDASSPFGTAEIEDERLDLSYIEEAALSTVRRTDSESSKDSGVADVTDDIANLTIADDTPKSEGSKAKKFYYVSRGIEKKKRTPVVRDAPYPAYGFSRPVYATVNTNNDSGGTVYRTKDLVEEANECIAQKLAQLKGQDPDKFSELSRDRDCYSMCDGINDPSTSLGDILLEANYDADAPLISFDHMAFNASPIYPENIGNIQNTSNSEPFYLENQTPYMGVNYGNTSYEPIFTNTLPSINNMGPMIADHQCNNSATTSNAQINESFPIFTANNPILSDRTWASPAPSYAISPASTSNGVEIFNDPEYPYDDEILYDKFLTSSPPNNAASPITSTSSPLNDFDNETNQIISPKAIQKKESNELTLPKFKKIHQGLHERFMSQFCCQRFSQEDCRKFFTDHLKNLNSLEKKYMCMENANSNLEEDERRVMNAIFELSKVYVTQHSVHYAAIFLYCEKIMGTHKIRFIQDFGLEILKASVFLCYKTPMIAKYIVYNIRTAIQELKREGYTNIPSPVFNERDALGDTVVVSCARAGDSHAAALSALADVAHPPLFNMELKNNEGRNALHEACLHHSPESPRLQIIHVLLNHAKMSVTAEDNRGGDTPLHYAVNTSCDLDLVLTLFPAKQHSVEEEPSWHAIANKTNKSNMSAKSLAHALVTKNSMKPSAQKVYDFLKKCPKPKGAIPKVRTTVKSPY